MEQNLKRKLHILGISPEELEKCKTKSEQMALVRKATRETIKNKKIHPDDPLTDLTDAEANATTRVTFEARDEILQAIKDGESFVDLENEDEMESPFIKMVNNKNKEELFEKFSSKRETPRKREEKGGLSKIIDKFNKRYFNVRDAINGLKEKLRGKVKNDNIER